MSAESETGSGPKSAWTSPATVISMASFALSSVGIFYTWSVSNTVTANNEKMEAELKKLALGIKGMEIEVHKISKLEKESGAYNELLKNMADNIDHIGEIMKFNQKTQNKLNESANEAFEASSSNFKQIKDVLVTKDIHMSFPSLPTDFISSKETKKSKKVKHLKQGKKVKKIKQGLKKKSKKQYESDSDSESGSESDSDSDISEDAIRQLEKGNNRRK
jgi:hypothetical protein